MILFMVLARDVLGRSTDHPVVQLEQPRYERWRRKLDEKLDDSAKSGRKYLLGSL